MLTQFNFDDFENMIPVDTLVHLGAGRCSELDDYLALHPRQLFLVEADPKLVEELQCRTEDLKPVQVICIAVAGQPGPATFQRINLPEVNSLHRASSLLELIPRAKDSGSNAGGTSESCNAFTVVAVAGRAEESVGHRSTWRGDASAETEIIVCNTNCRCEK